MSEYIRKDKALSLLGLDHGDYVYIDKYKIAKEIEQIPTIDAVEWIPCEERLPSDRKPKLVYLSSGRITIASYNEHIMSLAPYKPIGWGYDKYHMIDFEKEEVIAWMPLPQPYGERKERE